MFDFLFKSFAGRHHRKYVEKCRPIVARINEIEKATQLGTGDDESEKNGDADEESTEEAPEEGDEKPGKKKPKTELLQRLLYKGILPRYAFPTDVAIELR